MENLPIATIRPTSQLHKLVWAGWFLFTSMGSTGCTGMNVPPEASAPPKVPPLIGPPVPSTPPTPVTSSGVIKEKPSDHIPLPQPFPEVNTQKLPSPVTVTCQSIHTVGIHEVAARLAEMGYFQSSITQAALGEVTEALKHFQRDLKVNQSGCLDNLTLQKLNSVKLTGVRKAELDDFGHPATTENLPKSVLWIEKIECKSEHEVWVLYYEGTLSTQSSNVTLNKRYALWYDSRQQGESTEDWWCIPRKEFCYTPVKFSDWAGRYRVRQEIGVERGPMVKDLAELKRWIREVVKKKCNG